MSFEQRQKAAEDLARIKAKDPELNKEYEEKVKSGTSRIKVRSIVPTMKTTEAIAAGMPADDVQRLIGEREEESIARANFRPVLLIRDNKVVPEFAGPDVIVWRDRIMEREAILNGVIPSIGRVEVNNNAIYKWVGTGWLVDKDVIITNRHVASLFSKNAAGFTFKVGYPSGTQTARVDFLEEDQRTTSLEFDVESVLWIAENIPGQPDVAFLRVKQTLNGPPLPKPIPLADSVQAGEIVVTIGYPARDVSITDQELVLRIFGNVYDKKRLAPGEIIKVSEVELEHDCSTFGGNSGSAVIQLSTGKAVGLHFAGLYMQANYAVPATTIQRLLDQLRKGTLKGMRDAENTAVNAAAGNINNNINTTPMSNNRFQFEANIPIKITVEVGGISSGGAVSGPGTSGGIVAPSTSNTSFDQVLANAKANLLGKPGIISVEAGYRFRRGWITNERVIAVEVDEKMTMPQLNAAGRSLLPPQIDGVGVDVRTAGLQEQLEYIGIDVAGLEAPPSAGVYQDPPHLSLPPMTKRMVHALFHVSPDSAWPNLRNFLTRVEEKLTATIYEWESTHISQALFEAIHPGNRQLKMVTQKNGTEEAVDDMKNRLGDKFEHVYASVGGGKIVPMAYHIKVASRDGKEFWLSSGNWKNSNQDDIDPAGDNSTAITPLRQHNREWNVIIENEELATLFQQYIDWDFEEAHRVPLEEAVAIPLQYFFIPEIAFDRELERRILAQYFDPLDINREIFIQPLLTPDRNSRGQRMFMAVATEMIEKAQSRIDIENQSFNLLDDNVPEFERFFAVLKKKQDDGIPVRVIFRDPREFSRTGGTTTLQKLLDRVKAFGLDTDNIKVQEGCHTKAILVDSDNEDRAAVLFGSHNLTNMGALYNRDASLLIRDFEVTQYFQQIFNFDWEVLAKQSAEESVGGIRLAGPTEETPVGFRKVSLAEIISGL